MRIFPRSKTSMALALLTLCTLLAGLVVSGSPTARAASTASTAKTALLKLQDLGVSQFNAANTVSKNTTAAANENNDDLEIFDEGEDRNPKVAVNGTTPPIEPPPSTTPPPNPPSKPVVTNNPAFSGFNGLNHVDQRNAGTGKYTGTQFSLEPPDQALCVSGNYVIDSVNTALAIRTKSGSILSGPTPINQFFRLAPEIIRSTPPVYGDFTSDPKCYFDSATQRWFFTVLQSDVNPATGAFTGPSHTLLAVSSTADPTKEWRLFAIDTTNDGRNGTPSNPNCPCLGDQPLIGADENGFYISTNEFPQFVNGFNGAQLYAISKRALVAAATTGSNILLPTVVYFNLGQELVPYGGLSYSVQPATQPPGNLITGKENNGTEYFLSALEFTGVDNRIAVWALTNTKSLNLAVPDLDLHFKVIRSQLYAAPVPVTQKDGPRPLGEALKEPLPKLNSNDDRMNQVVYAAGVLWSGVNTSVQKPGEAARTGIAYFGVVPFWKQGNLDALLASKGYVAVDKENVIFPSIGANASGKAVMTFTLSGPDYYPSAGYMPLTLLSSGSVHIAKAGVAPEDGFTCYKAYSGNGVCRWGDYSAATTDLDGSIWLAVEYIPGPRTVLANWGTFISHLGANVPVN